MQRTMFTAGAIPYAPFVIVVYVFKVLLLLLYYTAATGNVMRSDRM